MAVVTKSNIACPQCRDQGISASNPIMTKQGDSAYFCDKGHRFPDRDELYARQPTMLAYVPPAPKPRQGDVKFAVNLPPELLGILQSRFSTRLDQVSRYFLEAMAEDGSFVVNNASAGQLGAHLGTKPDSAQKLLGLVWSLKQNADNAKEELKTVTGGKPQAGGTRSELTLDFDEGVLVTLRAKAKEQKLSLRSFLEQVITGVLEKGII